MTFKHPQASVDTAAVGLISFSIPIPALHPAGCWYNGHEKGSKVGYYCMPPSYSFQAALGRLVSII